MCTASGSKEPLPQSAAGPLRPGRLAEILPPHDAARTAERSHFTSSLYLSGADSLTTAPRPQEPRLGGRFKRVATGTAILLVAAAADGTGVYQFCPGLRVRVDREAGVECGQVGAPALTQVPQQCNEIGFLGFSWWVPVELSVSFRESGELGGGWRGHGGRFGLSRSLKGVVVKTFGIE